MSTQSAVDWVAQWFILYTGYKRTKNAQGSNPTKAVFPFFSGRKRKESGENHGDVRRPLDQSVGGGENHCKGTCLLYTSPSPRD